MSLDVERNVIFLLAKANQHVVSLCKKEFSEYKITQPQFILLGILWKQDTISQAELSEKTSIDRSTIAGIIDRLEERDLVERQSQPEDRRVNRIILTDRGRKLENELCDAASRVREKMRMRFSPDEGKTLEYLLKRLRE